MLLKITILLLVYLTICQATFDDLASLEYKDLHRFLFKSHVNNRIRPQKSLHTRLSNSLNGLYDFCLQDFDQGLKEKWYEKQLNKVCDEGNYYRIPVPSAFNEIMSNATVKNYIGWTWYQTVVHIPRILPEGHLFVQFENVNYLALVWAQELETEFPKAAKKIGEHVGGHLPFILNLTQVIDSRKDINLRLTIAVSNLLTEDTIPSGEMRDYSVQVGHKYLKFVPDFDFFHFAGIMGDVRLIQLPSLHLLEIDTHSNPISVDYCVSQPGIGSSVRVMLFGPNGRLIEESKQKHKANLSKTDNVRCQKVEFKYVDNDDYWTPSDGTMQHFSHMLMVRLELFKDKTSDTPVDVVEIKIGNRAEISLDTGGFKVFGKSIQLQGFGMHHEQMFSGRSMSLAAILKDIYLLKQMGANVIRTSHYPYSTEFLDACDENGIMVIAECPAVALRHFSNEKRELHKFMLREMMERDHHHPSIIMWSVANEPQSQLNASAKYFESILEYAKNELKRYTIDEKRPLTAAIAQEHSADKIGKFLDVIMVNRYYGWYDYTGVIEAVRLPLIQSLSGWSEKHPGKGLILSEFGADTVQGLHSTTQEIFSEEFQRDLLVEFEKTFDEIVANRSEKRINFWGSMIWNFADFSTHESLSRVGGNRKGIFTRERTPKLAVESIKSFYLKRLDESNGLFEMEELCE